METPLGFVENKSAECLENLNSELENLQNELDKSLETAENSYQKVNKNEFSRVFEHVNKPSKILVVGVKIYFCLLIPVNGRTRAALSDPSFRVHGE